MESPTNLPGMFISATTFAAIFHILPVALPLFPPGEGAFAYRADFFGEVLFWHDKGLITYILP